jgi:hypothetical protein
VLSGAIGVVEANPLTVVPEAKPSGSAK